ncbi:MAG: DUF4349 domain-containing protein [Candidatus Magasanikbacteria bacterium]|jgi:hypothetical protein|nr:DUF4349 domain-containing protein [Candidatus Magasanikbacteria bacterium]MBT4071365.1 DUF4349 domain-containing protein [Candidatus Magasanikbacteria bacterium]
MEKKNKIWIGIIGIILFILIVSFVTFQRSDRMSFQSASVGGYGAVPPMQMEKGMGLLNESVSAQKVSRDMVEDSNIVVDRLIIKTAELSVVVSDVRLAVSQVTAFAENNGGFIVESTIYERGLSPNATVKIKVPVKEFDGSIKGITDLGEVKSENITGIDVTEEFVDLDAQLGNLRAAETQFLGIMKTAVKIEDILAVQRELTNVRRDIERIEGKMKYLRQSADLSTITVHLATDPSVLPVVDEDDSWKPIAIVKDALRSLRGVGVGFLNIIIWFLVFSPVWVVISLLVWWGVRKIRA